MPSRSSRGKEIDHRVLRLIVGVIALFLGPGAFWLAYFSLSPTTVTEGQVEPAPIDPEESKLKSISASYHEGGWNRDYFVGSLYAISAFLIAYNGLGRWEKRLSKVGGAAALGIATFPCGSGTFGGWMPVVHGLCAAILFLILTLFCYFFWDRARDKKRNEATRRSYIYAACGAVMFLSIVLLAIDGMGKGAVGRFLNNPGFFFYGEAAALIAFGFAWLTASRVLPGITAPDERFSLFGAPATEQE